MFKNVWLPAMSATMAYSVDEIEPKPNSEIGVFATGPHSFVCNEVGYCAFGAMNLLQADKMDSTSWLDPRGTMSVKLDITGGAAATAYILTQQERTY